jgi:hypothetical protein
MGTVFSQEFENGTTGWDIGMSGDNATNGKWIVAVPIGSKTAGIQVQTDKDHTSGTGLCAVTGNAPNASSAVSSNEVNGGRTVIQSPVFDLSAYANPVVSFWRWFSNAQGTGINAGKNLWKVYMSDNGGTTYGSTFADKTFQQDVSWRRQCARIKDLKYNCNLGNIRFLFVALDSTMNSSSALVEAAIDDFEIWDQSALGISNTNLQAYIAPNPVNDILNIELANTAQALQVSLTDATGKIVYSNEVKNINTTSIATAALANGVYYLLLSTDGKSWRQKVVVSH